MGVVEGVETFGAMEKNLMFTRVFLRELYARVVSSAVFYGLDNFDLLEQKRQMLNNVNRK